MIVAPGGGGAGRELHSFVTGIISFLAKPALKSHRLMLQGQLIINENMLSIGA